jgi:hypothetical protein
MAELNLFSFLLVRVTCEGTGTKMRRLLFTKSDSEHDFFCAVLGQIRPYGWVGPI